MTNYNLSDVANDVVGEVVETVNLSDVANEVVGEVVETVNLSDVANEVVGEVVETVNLSDVANEVVGEVVEYNSASEFYGEVPFVPSAMDMATVFGEANNELLPSEFMSNLEEVANYESLSSYPPLSSAYRFPDGSILEVFHDISEEEGMDYFNAPTNQRFRWNVR